MVSSRSFHQKVGGILLDGGFITQQQLERAQQQSREKGISLLDALVVQGLSSDILSVVFVMQLRISLIDLRTAKFDPQAICLVPEKYATEHNVLPVGFDEKDGSLRIATKDPGNFGLSGELSTLTGCQVKLVFALGEGLKELIRKIYATSMVGSQQQEQSVRLAPTSTSVAPRQVGAGLLLDLAAANTSAVEAVNMVTLQAVKRGASDIHLVPMVDCSKVFLRMDGVLREAVMIPLTLHATMISRIKVLAEMDIAESRRPQDGSFFLQLGERRVDFRVSSIGTAFGERMVIRILDRAGGLLRLEYVGLDSAPLHVWRQLLKLPQGMLLVSGPTGSGKTTTLYASVMELVPARGNIMTVEDPIEYRMDALGQIEVNTAAGIDFPTGLRSIMRLDPDVILIGEIRDAQTAETAIKAALTGHLVLASIHSNDAAASIVRLLDLEVKPYLVSTAMAGALAQRLVRQVCAHCKVLIELSDMESIAYAHEMQEEPGQFWVGQGCNFCEGSGFSGRTGVFEVLAISAQTRKLIASGASGQEIKTQALADGMVPLLRMGMRKAKEGITTVGEVLRNTFSIE